jgi:serine/threonine protein kinase
LYTVGFSVATQLGSERDKAKTFVGTPYWMSPEVIEAKSGIASYDEKADIWALGITCIELAEVNPPLSEITPMRALFQIPVRDPPKLQNPKNWSPEFSDFLAQVLIKDPKDRKSAAELLQHSFVVNTKTSKVIVDLIQRRQKAEADQDGDDDAEKTKVTN